MVKTYLKLVGFAGSLTQYLPPYLIFAVLYAVFNAFNFAMIIPILNTMFLDESFEFTPVYTTENLTFSKSGFNEVINYCYTHIFGEDFSIQKMLILLATTTVIMTIISNASKYGGAITVENMRRRTLEHMRNQLFNHIMDMNVGYFAGERKGNIIAKFTTDVTMVQMCVTNTLQVLVREPLVVLGYLYTMFFISWRLSIFSIFFLPVVAIIVGTVIRRLRKSASSAQKINADMISLLDESISGTKIIKGYNATDYIKGRYHKLNKEYVDVSMSMARRQQLASPMSETMGITAVGVVIVYGGGLVAMGDLNAASFLAFIAIFSQITRPVRTIMEQFATINIGIAAGERVLSLLEEKSGIVDKEDAIELKEFKDKIEFRDVHFSYEPKHEVIRGVSFTVNKGETVALVGASGGGKSTLSELVSRYWDIQKGEILIDGVSIKDYTQDSLRAQMGIVSQDTVLFNDTIAANLQLGRRDATQEDIKQAAMVANAHSFITESKRGYKTNIGDRGMKLSGGQRQRLSIARAILKNPSILILDEATSALDTESEKLVQDALANLLVGRTSIVVAHRLSTIANADKILVVNEGLIAESGTHAELMSKGGIYAKLVDMQSFE